MTDPTRIVKPAFSVIGMEGSTDDGEGFIQRLWNEANVRYGEIAHLVKLNEDGLPAGYWGAMTDPSRAFAPWEDGLSKGLYLAGAEVRDEAQAPEGWTKWTVPGFEYLRVAAGDDPGGALADVIAYMEAKGLELAGAIHDFMELREGMRGYLFVPIEKR